MKKIKVAISQRIIPHYRVPVFKELASREDLDVTVFYGNGFMKGSQANASAIEGFRHSKLFTIFLNFKRNDSKQLRVWHPLLFFHLLFGGFDVVIAEPTTNFYNDIFIFIYCKIFKKKFIWYEAGTEPKEKRTKFRRMIDPIVNYFIKYSDSYITYTSYADISLIEYYNVDKKKIFRAQNTVDTYDYPREIEKFKDMVKETKQQLNLAGYKVVLYIGGIEKRKKINNAITATANLNGKGMKAKTLIVGDGEDIGWIKEQMTDVEKTNTVFAGKHVADAVLYVLLADVVVLPSQGGLSVTQAFACGKPFIGSEEIEHGGIKDYVFPGYNGYLVKEDNVADLQQALELVLTDTTHYLKLCEGAFETSKKITVPNMVDGIVNAIRYSLK